MNIIVLSNPMISAVSCLLLFLLATETVYSAAGSTEGDMQQPDTKECCRQAGVPDTCADFMCDVNRPPPHLQLFNQTFKRCAGHLGVMAGCLADGRNHLPCCQQLREPPDCFDLCTGRTNYSELNKKVIVAEYFHYMQCLSFNVANMYKCFRTGYTTLPTPPRDVRVLDDQPPSPSSVRITWRPSAQLPEKVKLFRVDYAIEEVNDNTSISMSATPSTAPSDKLSVATTSSNSITLTHLVPDTKYRVQVTGSSENGERLSLGSEPITFITQGVKPEIEPYWGKREVTAARGPVQILVCRITLHGFNTPMVQIKWTRRSDGVELGNNGNVKYEQTSYQSQLTSHHKRVIVATLTVHDTTPADFGRYTCHANNSFGASSAEMELRRPSPLRIPSAPPTAENASGGCGQVVPRNNPNATSFLSNNGPSLDGIVRMITCTLKGRNNGNCCLRQKVPSRCLTLCQGSSASSFDGRRSRTRRRTSTASASSDTSSTSSGFNIFSCLNYTEAIFGCDLEAKRALPSVPSNPQLSTTAGAGGGRGDEGSEGSDGDGGRQDNVQIEWNSSKGADNYLVYYQQVVVGGNNNNNNDNEQSRRWTRLRTSGTQLKIPAGTLQQRKNYQFIIMAQNEYGLSSPSRPVDWPLKRRRDSNGGGGSIGGSIRRRNAPQSLRLVSGKL